MAIFTKFEFKVLINADFCPFHLGEWFKAEHSCVVILLWCELNLYGPKLISSLFRINIHDKKHLVPPRFVHSYTLSETLPLFFFSLYPTL